MKKVIFLFLFLILLFPVISKADSFTISSSALLDWGSFTMTGVDVEWGQIYTKAVTANVPRVLVDSWSVPVSNDSQIDNFTITSIATDSIMSTRIDFSYSKDQYNSDNGIYTHISRVGRFHVDESGPLTFSINYKFDANRAIDPSFQPLYMSSSANSSASLFIYPDNPDLQNADANLMLPYIIGTANDSKSKEGTLTSYGNFIKGVDYYFNIVLRNRVDAYVSVPEPATMVLLGLGLIGLAGVRRNIRK